MANFADRPERQVGVARTARVLAAVGFDSANLPNAGLEAQTDDGERVVIVEVMNPRLEDATWTLIYDVRQLADHAGAGLGHLAAKPSDEGLPEAFGPASLSIDGGCPYPICDWICYNTDEGMVCQGKGTYCVSTSQLGICTGGTMLIRCGDYEFLERPKQYSRVKRSP